MGVLWILCLIVRHLLLNLMSNPVSRRHFIPVVRRIMLQVLDVQLQVPLRFRSNLPGQCWFTQILSSLKHFIKQLIIALLWVLKLPHRWLRASFLSQACRRENLGILVYKFVNLSHVVIPLQVKELAAASQKDSFLPPDDRLSVCVLGVRVARSWMSRFGIGCFFISHPRTCDKDI